MGDASSLASDTAVLHLHSRWLHLLLLWMMADYGILWIQDRTQRQAVPGSTVQAHTAGRWAREPPTSLVSACILGYWSGGKVEIMGGLAGGNMAIYPSKKTDLPTAPGGMAGLHGVYLRGALTLDLDLGQQARLWMRACRRACGLGLGLVQQALALASALALRNLNNQENGINQVCCCN
jgi:hypothetical protein